MTSHMTLSSAPPFRYNIDNNDDDPLSEQVVEEMRHADAIKDIRYVHA